MDLDGFNQCLAYIQATTVKPTVDKYLPLVGTVVGAGLAFGLNFFSTARKEAKTKAAKKRCCEEDCHELMNICEQSIGSLLELCEALALKKRPAGHNLVSAVSLPLLEKYYPEIAHSFSVDQRYWIKLIFRHVEVINRDLEKLVVAELDTSLYRISIEVINLESILFESYKLCLRIISNKKYEFSEHHEALIELGMNPEHVGWLKMLQDNAESGNGMLNLPNSG